MPTEDVEILNSKMGKALGVLSGVEACGARWTLGALLLAPLAAANSSYCAVPAILILATFITIATFTYNDLIKLSVILPPSKTCRGRRERNLRSFGDFMVMWMIFLSHLVAVAICARILSATADHITEGRTRKWLFGYETRSLGEPWPDVLGVTVVMVVCAMFMCGLEESVMFTFLLLILLYIFSQIFAIFGLIHLDITNINMPIPVTIYELFAAGAPISYTFNVAVLPKENTAYKKKIVFMIVLPAVILAGICFLYTNMLKANSISAALPITTLLETKAPQWINPLLVAVTVAGVGLALTELCPLLFNVLVVLASPEWKVLTRSMTYESSTTGSPVLAVFTAGSLAAILAFACPLSHMITLLNASHLLGISIQAFHFTAMRCVPTAEQKEAGEVEYKRLGTESSLQGTNSAVVSSSAKKTSCSLWFIPSALRHTKTLESIKSKVIKDKEEREFLLLDEYAGYTVDEVQPEASASSTDPNNIVVNVTEVNSDPEASDLEPSSDDSTDIDAAVKEYKDRIHVVTAIPEAVAPTPPCVRGARMGAVGVVLQVVAIALVAAGLCNESLRTYMLSAGIPLWIGSTLVILRQPAHNLGGSRKRQALQGPVTLTISLFFLTPHLLDSWPAIILFSGAGVVLYARCERWCGDLAMQHARMITERRKLHVTTAVPLNKTRLSHVDTLYISR